MKKISIIVLSLFLFSTFATAEWISQDSTTSHSLLDVDFVSDSTGYAVGGQYIGFPGFPSAVALKTTNAGETWTPLTVPTNDQLQGVCFIDENVGWTVGNNNTILKTIDGGETWTWQNSTVRLVGASVPWFTGVTCIDENVVYAVGLNGVIVKTANGGERWQWVHGNRDASDESLQAISCTDANTCWAVGLGSTVLKTGNSGETWEQQPVIGNSFFDVFFLDSTHGWVAGDVGRIRRTIDGATWTNQTLDAFSSLRSIYFINETHGWTASSSIKFTNNSGENWYAESTDRLSLPIMRGLDFPSSQVGWLVGDEGVILRYGQPSERGNLSIGYPDRMVYSVNRTQTCQSDLDECVNQINQTCTFIASRPTEEQAAQCRIDAQGDCNNDYQACLAGELTDASSEVQQGAEEGEGQREQPIEADELTQEEINQDAQTEQQSRQQAQVAFNPVQSVVSIVQGAVNWFAKLFGG